MIRDLSPPMFHSLRRRLRDGEAFRRRWLESGRDFVAIVGAVIGAVFHFASLFTDPYVAAPSYVPVLTGIHEIILGTLLAWLLIGRPFKLKLRHVFYGITIFSVAAYAYILHLCVADGASLEEVTFASAAAFALAVFCILLCPTTSLVVALTAPVYLAMIWFAYDGHEAATRWLVIDALGIAMATSFHFGRGLLAQKQATAEYHRLNSLGNKARGEQAKRRDAEQQLKIERAIALQAAKMASLAEMTAGIAHEINSPLSVIRVRAERLARTAGENGARPEDLRDSAQRIVDTVDRISKIMTGMRCITRNGDGDPFAVESLAAIVTDVCELSQSRLRAQSIDLRMDAIAENLTLECRSVEVAQVLVNLLNNACDAVATRSDRWVRLDVKEDGDGIQIRVTDSGDGIPRRIRDRLFKPLTTTKPVGFGTGLGLSISKALIEAHGGTLTLDPASHHTTFLVWLPKRQAQAAQSAA